MTRSGAAGSVPAARSLNLSDPGAIMAATTLKANQFHFKLSRDCPDSDGWRVLCRHDGENYDGRMTTAEVRELVATARDHVLQAGERVYLTVGQWRMQLDHAQWVRLKDYLSMFEGV